MCTKSKAWILSAVLAGVTFLTVIPSQRINAQPQLPQTEEQNVNGRNETVTKISAANTTIQLVERSSRILELDSRIKLVDGFDPEVLEVTSINVENKIRLRAHKSGVTTMTIVDENNISYAIEIFVVGDVRHLQVTINRLFPKASVQAIKVADSVVLKGWVTQPEHITNIVEIAEQFFGTVLNHMRVGGGQQVLLRCKVMEVQRSKIRRLGINFFYLNENAYFANTTGQLSTLSTATLPFGGPPAVAATPALLADSNFIGGFTNDSNIFQAYVEALKEESLLKILAEPALVATNGRPANLLSGGEFPILVPQSLGVIGIEWREFGVRLEAVPILLGDGRLRLELQPEVSERDFSNAVQVQGLTVPGLTSRRVNTQVEMRFGETFVLAGLIATRETAETAKVPVLGDMPWIGAAFRRVRYDDTETELVIMVTPELIAPIPSGEVPHGGPGQFTDAPTARELYIDGMIEIPKYGDRCNGTNCIDTGYGVPVNGTQYLNGTDYNVHETDSRIISPHGEVMPPTLAPEETSTPVLENSVGKPTESTTLNTNKSNNNTKKVSFWRKKDSSDKKTTLSNFFKSKPKEEDKIQSSAPVNKSNNSSWKPTQTGLIEPKPGLIEPDTVKDPFLDQ